VIGAPERDPLDDVAHLKLSTLLRRNDRDTENALWDLIHDQAPACTLAQALRIVTEVSDSGKRVRDVQDGWRPSTVRELAGET